MHKAIGRLTPSLLFLLLCIPCVAQQGAKPDDSPRDLVAEARERLHAAEVAHPGNTVEVAEAQIELLEAEVGRKILPEFLESAKQVQAVAEAAAGPRSEVFANSLVVTSDVYTRLGRLAEARIFADRAFEIAQQEFPDSPYFAKAAYRLAIVCEALADHACALRAGEAAIAIQRKNDPVTVRKAGPDRELELAGMLMLVAWVKDEIGDHAGADVAFEETLSIYLRSSPDHPYLGIIESVVGYHYTSTQQFSKAISHLNRGLELNIKNFGPDASYVVSTRSSLAEFYSRTGDFSLAWKNFESVLGGYFPPGGSPVWTLMEYARSLASGGDLPRAIKEGLLTEQIGRESFVLQARTLPERQALDFSVKRLQGVNVALSVLARHPEFSPADIYQEMVRSRALVADEMARRQKNLNASNDPEVARLLKEMDQARADLVAVERKDPKNQDDSKAAGDAVSLTTSRMEKIERELAERSVDLRNDERISAVRLEDLRRGLPAHSVLISYVAYKRYAVEKVDPAATATPAYMAFVLKPDSQTIRVYDLGDAKPIDDLVNRARATADAEAHAGGLGSVRNEREWREAAETLRQRIWDPLRGEVGDAKLALVVPDGLLNLIPFSGLPEGKGYLVEHGPVIHILSSERDLVPAEGMHQKIGLLAVGNPAFKPAANRQLVASLRDAGISCENLDKVEFRPLPGTAAEINDINAAWRRWNSDEPSALETGAGATRARFLEEAPRSRVLHIATHAFLLDSRCGNDNPLLRSGFVFTAGNDARASSILTAQQIASMDLSGLDWAVLSACNTGNGELRDGEGVLGLERAFREAGARSMVMALWPVDDEFTRQFMHELYDQRLGHHASTANAVWNADRKLLLARRAAGKSTHPWYWAGFVGSGAWE